MSLIGEFGDAGLKNGLFATGLPYGCSRSTAALRVSSVDDAKLAVSPLRLRSPVIV